MQFGTFGSTGDGTFDALVFILYGLQASINILTLALALHLPFDLGSMDGTPPSSVELACMPIMPIVVIFGGFSITVIQSFMIFDIAVIYIRIVELVHGATIRSYSPHPSIRVDDDSSTTWPAHGFLASFHKCQNPRPSFTSWA